MNTPEVTITKDSIFEEQYNILLRTIESSFPVVFKYLNGEDEENKYMSDLNLPYILIADITHYLEVLYKKGDFESIKGILILFDSMLQSGKIGRNHILISFCDIIGHYPDVLKGIFSIMPDTLRNETLGTL